MNQKVQNLNSQKEKQRAFCSLQNNEALKKKYGIGDSATSAANTGRATPGFGKMNNINLGFG